MNFIIIGLLIVFYLVNDNKLKSLVLLLILYLSINKINQEHFSEDTFIDKFLKNSDIKKIVNKCCTKEEQKLIKEKINCISKSEDTYNLLMNNVNKIMPSKLSILSSMASLFNN
mgnify:CR=1 FL=1